MASRERKSSFRHEGHMFFIYDHKMKTEEDDPKDAILYFYPRSVDVDVQIALVGGLIGLADFCTEFLPQCMPSLVKLAGHNFALLQHEDFVIGLAGSPDIPDKFLVSHMQYVWSTFIFYQGSLLALKERVSSDHFLRELNQVWDMYVPLCQLRGDILSQAFQILPYVQLHKSQGGLFLHASHILQRSLRHKGVIAGALFSRNRVLCSQLSNSLTRKLLFLMSHNQFPCVRANSFLELPGGVRLLYVFLPKEERDSLGQRRSKQFGRSASSLSQDSVEEDLRKTPLTSAAEKSSPFSSQLLKNSNPNYLFSDSAAGTSSEPRDKPSRGGLRMKSPTSAAITSGTDSDVFLDTLQDIQLDGHHNNVKLADIKEVQCRVSGHTSHHQPGSAPATKQDAFTSSSDTVTPHLTNLTVSVEVHADGDTAANQNKPAGLSPGLGNTRDSFSADKSVVDIPVISGEEAGACTEKGQVLRSSHDPVSARDGEDRDAVGDLRPDNNVGNKEIPDGGDLKTDFDDADDQRQDGGNTKQPPTPSNDSCNTQQVNHISSSSSENSTLFPTLESENVKENIENAHGKGGEEQMTKAPKDRNECSSNGHQGESLTDNKVNGLPVVNDVLGGGSGGHDDEDAAQSGSSVDPAVLPQSDDSASRSNCNPAVLNDNTSAESSSVCNSFTGKDQFKSIETTGEKILNEKKQEDESQASAESDSVSVVDNEVTAVEIPRTTSPDADADTRPQVRKQLNSTDGSGDHSQVGGADTQNLSSTGQNQSTDSPVIDVAGKDSGLENVPLDASPRVTDSPVVSENKTAGGGGAQTDGADNVTKTSTGTVCWASLPHEGWQERNAGNNNVFEGHMSEENAINVRKALVQSKEEIDASLDTQRCSNSGEDSSNHSEQKLEDLDGSQLSLTKGGNDGPPSKDRLTFEFLDSENSEGGIMSPFSEHGRLSPVAEQQDPKVGQKFLFPGSGSEQEGGQRSQGAERSKTAQFSVGGNLSSSEPARTATTTAASPPPQRSPKWDATSNGLEELTLYVQGHSDTLLVLLLKRSTNCSKNYINSLWKSCLSHLAELDFEVKDAERHMKDDSENLGASYQFMKYDPLTQKLRAFQKKQGSALQPVTSLANEIVDSCVQMHESFTEMPDLQDVTFRSHSASILGHRNASSETFFQTGLPRSCAGISTPGDKTFVLDQEATRVLLGDCDITML
ncbi:uncharacterized protein LOC101858984 isoform X2 [Aplysia californica]|uniref:Uncharacterized protein LOC101858984 isoform X2 n=1 Tax=Aplysia californica TaxID=6500 RepID=A0ABM1W3H8_APLCA|nr:uncharacterized protein LOC101858984 isoform X2 [Aplysia californica]